ncbi:hypothetical protein FRUB_00285 [Fimbriiglobus ruber]|uniref:Uncharacterized protein n=1 Tax=Fimbriiglobus ruber TaxID=1908690 RepID=A0A225E942_9BACT|nr:hypothetical protein FRUB_00285 [Fimbriiglobus ruber]
MITRTVLDHVPDFTTGTPQALNNWPSEREARVAFDAVVSAERLTAI